jgi:hypothetical protein
LRSASFCDVAGLLYDRPATKTGLLSTIMMW